MQILCLAAYLPLILLLPGNEISFFHAFIQSMELYHIRRLINKHLFFFIYSHIYRCVIYTFTDTLAHTPLLLFMHIHITVPSLLNTQLTTYTYITHCFSSLLTIHSATQTYMYKNMHTYVVLSLTSACLLFYHSFALVSFNPLCIGKIFSALSRIF